MGRNKNISNYYQELEKKKKAEAAQKRNKILIRVSAIVLIIAAVIGIVFAIISVAYQPDPIKVVMEVKDYGKVTLELYPDIAPKTVSNFVSYVEDGFYDGLTFHRVIEDFMVQGGDPKGDGTGDRSLPTIKGEFTSNGFTNNLKFKAGVIGMARSDHKDSASSQFFICHKDSPHLNGEYASFGKVIEGMDVIDAIATCEKNESIADSTGTHYVPKTKIYIEKMYVIED